MTTADSDIAEMDMQLHISSKTFRIVMKRIEKHQYFPVK
jgi:hypothetical protein